MANSYGAYTKLGNCASLANAAYSSSIGTIDLGAAPPHECWIHALGLTPNTSATAGNTAAIYVSASADNTNFADAPADANTALNARFLGSVTFTANTTAHNSSPMPVSAAFGGALPRYLKIYVYNNSGAAFSSGTGTAVNEIGYSTETFG